MKLSDPVIGGATGEEGKRGEAQRAAVSRLLGKLDSMVGLCSGSVLIEEITRWEAWLQGLAARVEKLKQSGFSRASALLAPAKPVYRAILECKERIDKSALIPLVEQVRTYYEKTEKLRNEYLPDRDAIEETCERLDAELRELETRIQSVLTECRTPLLGIKSKIDSVEQIVSDLEGAYGALAASIWKPAENESLVGAAEGEILLPGAAPRTGNLFVCQTRMVFEAVELTTFERFMNFFTPQKPRRSLVWERATTDVTRLSARRDDGLVSRLALSMEIEGQPAVIFRASPPTTQKVIRLLQVLQPSLKKPAAAPGAAGAPPGPPRPGA